MYQEEKETLRCEAVFNEDHTHRFLWKRIWDEKLPLAGVIMLNPCQSDGILLDVTSMLVMNNVAQLEGYGGVEVVNLYSKITDKLCFRWNSDEELNLAENDTFIRKMAAECKTVIVAWGKTPDSNQRAGKRAEKVLQLLRPHSDKLFCTTDGTRTNLHPLTPAIRHQWQLEKMDTEKTAVKKPARSPGRKKKAEAAVSEAVESTHSAEIPEKITAEAV